jgi:hypothetical protein
MRRRQSKNKCAFGECCVLGFRCVGGRDGGKCLEEVFVAEIFVAGDGCDVGDGDVQVAGVLVVIIIGEGPETKPDGDIGFELGDEGVEVGGGGIFADYVEDSEENVVAGCGLWGEDVEDCGECGDGEGGAVLWGRGDGLLEILADSGEELVLD